MPACDMIRPAAPDGSFSKTEKIQRALVHHGDPGVSDLQPLQGFQDRGPDLPAILVHDRAGQMQYNKYHH